MYRYFSTPGSMAINADLPIPSMPAPTGKIGVPSILAGRQLPSDATYTGTGWTARGIICKCQEQGFGDAGGAVHDLSHSTFAVGAVAVAAFGVAAYFVYKGLK